MFHDRVAFGGALIAIGVLYMWLAEFPLRRGEAWAWWAFVVSGIFGFGSFLAYLGYGYLDTWHGAATLLVLPCFVIGLAKSRAYLEAPRGIGSLSRPGASVSWLSPLGMGSCASFGCRWRHDCRWFDGHDIWHDPSVCATGSDLHGPGEVRSANNKYAPNTLDCARSGWLWRRDLHDGSHGAPLRVVCQALTKSLADTVSRRCNWVCRGNRSTSDCGLQRSASPGACNPRSNHVRRRFDPVLAANAIALNHNLLCPDTLHL